MKHTIPGWIKVMMWVVALVFAAHLAAEYVVHAPQWRMPAAYTTAVVFPLATLVLFVVVLAESSFGWFLRSAAIMVFVAYAVGLVLHLRWLRDPSGWGWISGFVLLGYNILVFVLYCVLLKYRWVVVDFRARMGW